MAKYKTNKNFINVYDQDEKIIDTLPAGKTIEVSEIVKSGKDKEIAILKNGCFIIASYQGISVIDKMKERTKK